MALEHAESGEVFDLQPLGDQLKSSFTRAIVKTDSFEVIRLIVHAGERIPEHKVTGAITLHCLEGRAHLELEDSSIDLAANDWVYLEGGVLHAVSATEDSALLLTIFLGTPRGG